MIVFRWFKNALLFILKEIASFLIKIVMVMVIIIVLLAVFVPKTPVEKAPIKKNTYIELDLSNPIGERGSISIFTMEGEKVNFYNMLNYLDKGKNDQRIDGLILKVDNVALNRAQVEELGRKIKEYREAGKKVYAFSRGFENRNYSLAVNADEIIMPPSKGAGSNISGYFMELPYMKRLSDKIGVKYEVIHVGDYKSYGENYVREEMSPEFRENITRLLDRIYYNFVQDVSVARNIDERDLSKKILNGDFVLADAFKMKEEKLVDSLMYYHEFLRERNIVNKTTLGKYSRSVVGHQGSGQKIAVIYGDGEILYTNGGRGTKQAITPDTMISELDMAVQSKDVAGIVLRIDSPGGSALASEVINAKIRSIEKPVYVSMGGTSASGGYYISASGDRIFAERDTITGSIGVVSLVPDVSELAGKLGIKIESVQKGKLSGIYSITDGMNKDEKERIYQSSSKIYSEFKERVSSGRNIPMSQMESLAGGRVWLGEEALEKGLVDGIGGLQDTIGIMAKDLQLSEYSVVEIRRENPFEKLFMNYKYLENFYSRFNNIMNLEINDEKEMLESELIIKPVTYLPYKI
ncbi:signal peptide peptidase SppA [Ilyobacter sp.]|uniref:signal peptide peptidase SppA n=1 Tax=Ilyobacter sp. TaxID=3100343 RepID=UPI0035679A23